MIAMDVPGVLSRLGLDGALIKLGVSSVHAQYATTAVIGLLLIWFLQGWRRASTRLPGPTPLFLLGNLLSLSNSSTRNNVILRWAEKYGGIFRLWLLRTPYVVVTDPSLAHELLVTHAAQLVKPKRYCSSISQMLPGSGSCLLTSMTCSDTWRASRKCLSHSFSVPEVALDCEVARTKTLQLVEVLASLGPGVAVNMADATTRLSLDVLGLAKLGYDFGAVETPEEVLMLRLLRECSAEWAARRALPIRPWLSWFSDSCAEGRHRFQILRDFVRTLWSSVRAQGPPADDDLSLAAQLQRLRNPSTGAVVPEPVMLSELAGQLVAGHEALGHALAWCLQLLAAHPLQQEALHRELLDTGCVDEPALLTLEALGSLPCLDGVVREAMRLYPTWGEGPARQTTARLTLAGGKYTLPKGTHVWVHTYAMQRSSRNWVDGGKFQPDRWQRRGAQPWPQPAASTAAASAQAEGASGTAFDGFASCPDACGAAEYLSPAPQAAERPATCVDGAEEAGGGAAAGPRLCAEGAFMPFGAGPRSCLGQSFAQAHLKICLGILVAYFKFELSGDNPSLYAASAGLSLGPQSEGLPLILSMRYPEMFQG